MKDTLSAPFRHPKYGAYFKFGALSLTLVVTASLFTQAFSREAADHKMLITKKTNELLNMIKEHERVLPASKHRVRERMVRIAGERKVLLQQTLETDPGAFLLQALPASLRNAAPAEVQGLLEEHVSISGTLQVLHSDNWETGISVTDYFLESENHPGKKFKLHFAGKKPLLQTDSIVVAHGVRLDEDIILAGAETTEDTESTSSLEVIASATVEASVNYSALVLRVSFSNQAVGCSNAGLDNTFFTSSSSIDKFYREASFDGISFAGDAHGPFTIASDGSGCNIENNSKLDTFALQADQAARAAGIPVDSYSHIVYVLPSACGAAAWGNIGGSPGRTWVDDNYCGLPDVFAHELGHNLGMDHASTLSKEYGDFSDVMGAANIGLRHLNGPHKVQMGWVPSGRVQTVSQDGTYQISLLEQTSAGAPPQVLTVQNPNTFQKYYFSYRSPVGFDASGLRSEFQNRTSVHTWPFRNTYLQSVLGDGQTFSDTPGGITVQQLSNDGNTATLAIDYPEPVCTPGAPTVSVSPLSQMTSAGNVLNYSITIRNNDNSNCPDTTFAVSDALPANWSSSFSPLTTTIAGGIARTITWSVTSNASALDASYGITATVTDTADSGSGGTTVNATYIVFTDVMPPTVAITQPLDGEMISSKKIVINVQSTDNVDVTRLQLYFDGILKKDVAFPPGLFQYSLNTNKEKISAGDHTITATVFDVSNNSASHSITITTVKGGGGGGKPQKCTPWPSCR